jgi:hypothetical protein
VPACLVAWLARGLAGAGILLGTGLAAGVAHADEPRSVTEPRVMLEPGEVTNVIDAFDEGNPFDLNISLGFDYTSKSARILRETAIAAPGLTTGGFTTHLLNVAQYNETTSRLSPRIDLGLYHDIAVHIAAPIILGDARQLTPIGGVPPLAEATAGAPGEQLFSVPFTSPTRSGLEYLAAGFDFDILDQARDRTKPTWLFGFEGRFSVGTPMHACNSAPAPGQLQCADPSDIKRNGNDTSVPPANGIALEGTFGPGDRGPGVTRGTIALEVHTLMSKRVKYVEPYGGFTALFEFQQDSSDYGITDLNQSLVNHPPLVGTAILGMMIIPWENREKYGRLTFDLRVVGQYHSEGRDYSELFDALGSSAAPSLRNPQWAGYLANPNPAGAVASPSVIDTGSQKTYTTGLTDVLAYGSYRGSASVMWRASQYIKFQFGVGYGHDQGHVLTGDAPCNPNGGTVANSGSCHTTSQSGAYVVTGVPNPNFRQSIDDVGRRFWVDASNTFDLFASGVVMF